MLPVKWMPPEAFLDGIFTAKVNILHGFQFKMCENATSSQQWYEYNDHCYMNVRIWLQKYLHSKSTFNMDFNSKCVEKLKFSQQRYILHGSHFNMCGKCNIFTAKVNILHVFQFEMCGKVKNFTAKVHFTWISIQNVWKI